ncbi:ribosomal L28e/Mak16 [Lipomyces tetrasporus]|uniref:Ribosomal L28e/Mak16 n=1 Tax=Lipomyces tetrasporus TaxID=54092 RepID=A0AAD7VRT4_9ASCO|nr:ribosomal L28e/Mak16 [Lipomyces tetrasporus]KAJ8099251.1 ribosomal L28e/Mak16 [Lipomyces tetrasporus]
MSSISNDLIWELTRANSSYLVKRKSGAGVQFSREPLNLTNKHTYVQSGVANTKAVGVSLSDSGSIVLSTKKAGTFATPGKSIIATTFKPYKTNRKVYAAVAGATKGYRDDLRPAAVSRASALLASKKPKKTQVKKLRGKKATA